MRTIKLTATIFAASLFLTACNKDQTQSTATQPYSNDAAIAETEGDEYWAKDNLDLERVGNLLERSNSPQEFEEYLNDDDGINNLDLNGDGYADYISVEEFDDQSDSNSRGLSLFSRFGPDVIQEIAKVILYRDGPNYPGARFLINGNEQLYGDNNYYETNWLDRSIPMVSTLFGNHDRYRSPYYYDNYPSGYEVYEIVDTPVYRTRVVELYPKPVFIYTTSAPVYLSKVKIRSPHHGRWMDKIHARLAKPTREQQEFIRSNPGRVNIGKLEKGAKHDDNDGRRDDKGGRKDDKGGRENDSFRADDNPKADHKVERGNDKSPKAEKHDGGSPKGDNPGKGQGQGKGQGGGKGKKQ